MSEQEKKDLENRPLTSDISSSQTDLVDVLKPENLLEKQKSLRLFAELIKARKVFYENEFLSLNLWWSHESNFQGQLESAQKGYEKKARKVKNLEKMIDKTRNVMMEWVNSYEELLAVALWEIDEYGLDTMASFPIFSSGRGTGDPLLNCEIAQKFIRYLTSQGNERIFNQIPYLDMNLPRHVIVEQNIKEKFEKFYIPLLRSGKIKKMCMMRWWENSPGCVREHEVAQEQWIEISYPKSYTGMGVKYW
jgi:hypothetical protein